tara:strand:+ start:2660 stop:3307 length:648 start_codon:yes stop_codon:yes gene_type:complete
MENNTNNFEKVNITNEKIDNLTDNFYMYNYEEKPFLKFYKEQTDPLIFKTTMFEDIPKEDERNFILNPDVCKCIIGIVFSNYNIDYETIKIEKIYEILGYIQFFKIRTIAKNGFYHHFGVYNTNKQEQVIKLYTQEIYESYFPIGRFKPINEIESINYYYTNYDEDGYIVPVVEKKYKTIHITMEYLIEEFNMGILEYLDIFTLSKVIRGSITNP